MKRTALSPKRKRKPTRVYQVVDGVRIYPDGREVCLENTEGRETYLRRRFIMWRRQDRKCAMCQRVIKAEAATFDHEAGRGAGGAHRDDRIWTEDAAPQNAALCLTCNTNKGSRRYAWQQGEYLPVVRADFPEAA